jgi:hypothetical protein
MAPVEKPSPSTPSLSSVRPPTPPQP